MTNKLDLDKKAIGERIRTEREKLDLSREDLAALIELSDYYVGQLERGERQMSLPVLVNISHSLHISLDYLIFGNNNLVYYACESHDHYETPNTTIDRELYDLLKKCSPKELALIKKLIKTILPYI